MNNRFFALAEVFVMVVRHNSITDAASELRTSKSNVSQKISDLEAMLDVVLLHRTTRKMAITPAGRRIFEACVAAVDETASAAISVGLLVDQAGTLGGRVTISASSAYPLVWFYPAYRQCCERSRKSSPYWLAVIAVLTSARKMLIWGYVSGVWIGKNIAPEP